MKNDARKYWLLGALAFALLLALGVVFMWLMDNVFNGVVLDALSWLVMRVDSFSGNVSFNTSLLARLGLFAVFLLALLLSATGAFCAYRAHARQQALIDSARAEAARAKELAEREMQRKSDLITYLAHDLKTPLASVIAYLSLLEESPELSAAQRAKYTGIALEKAYRLERLTGELFEIIRFNLQTIELDKETIHLKLMLLQLADEFYPLLLPLSKRIAIDCEDGLTVPGDPDKLARVFNNILKNAVAYGEANTEIRVSARRYTNNVIVKFINSGARIPNDKLARLFEKFYRADAARSTATGGAGLGLAIAKEIVEAHGGTISAESDAERTVFSVKLPADERAIAKAKPA